MNPHLSLGDCWKQYVRTKTLIVCASRVGLEISRISLHSEEAEASCIELSCSRSEGEGGISLNIPTVALLAWKQRNQY